MKKNWKNLDIFINYLSIIIAIWLTTCFFLNFLVSILQKAIFFMYSIGTVLLNAFLLYLTRDTSGWSRMVCLRPKNRRQGGFFLPPIFWSHNCRRNIETALEMPCVRDVINSSSSGSLKGSFLRSSELENVSPGRYLIKISLELSLIRTIPYPGRSEFNLIWHQ